MYLVFWELFQSKIVGLFFLEGIVMIIIKVQCCLVYEQVLVSMCIEGYQLSLEFLVDCEVVIEGVMICDQVCVVSLVCVLVKDKVVLVVVVFVVDVV